MIIKFKKGFKKYKTREYILGPVLLNKKDNDTFEYYKYEYCKFKEIISNIPKKYILKRFKIKCILKRLNNYIKNVGPSL